MDSGILCIFVARYAPVKLSHIKFIHHS